METETKMKYTAPTISVVLVELENCVAAASIATNGPGSPILAPYSEDEPHEGTLEL